MRLTLALTDLQLALLQRCGEAEGVSPGELLARAVADDRARPVDPRWSAPRPRRGPRRRTPGPLRLDAVLPAASGRAVELRTGERLGIEQLVDGQCVDLTAAELGGARRAFSAARTRAEHGIHPTVGASLWSTPPETPLLSIVSDSAPGHDLCFPACTPFEYAQLTGLADHLSCHALLAGAARGWEAAAGAVDGGAVGSGAWAAATGDVFNLWLPSEVAADGTLASWPVACRRGDHIELVAQADLVVLLSTCPDDVFGSAQFAPGPVRVTVEPPVGPAERPSVEQRSLATSRPGQPNVTRAPAPQAGALNRHPITVALSDADAGHLDAVRAHGWLGTSRAAVARALLVRYCAASSQTDSGDQLSTRSSPTATSADGSRRLSSN